MDILATEPKLCKVPGDVNGIECPRSHYCCKWGCCITPAFQFYQLWYYWVLVILMFMLCSGGGWWYRYWLAGRFPGMPTSQVHRLRHVELGSVPRSTDSTLSGVALNREMHRPCVRFSYNPARHAVMIERLWKVPARGPPPPPSYSQSESGHRAGEMMASQAEYQLYGPPPSYDSVIALNSESVENTISQRDVQNDVINSQPAQSHEEQQEVSASSSQNGVQLHPENEHTSCNPQISLPQDSEHREQLCAARDPVLQSH